MRQVKGFFQILSISYSENSSSIFKSKTKSRQGAIVKIMWLNVCEAYWICVGYSGLYPSKE